MFAHQINVVGRLAFCLLASTLATEWVQTKPDESAFKIGLVAATAAMAFAVALVGYLSFCGDWINIGVKAACGIVAYANNQLWCYGVAVVAWDLCELLELFP